MATAQRPGFASRLWQKVRLVDIKLRVDEISKRFTGAGWRNLPQELVDKIFGYLLGDIGALKACSLTCKRLFGATRPLIHRRLVCSDSRPALPAAPKGFLFSGRKIYPGEPGAFDRLTDVDRSGLLHYARHLTFEPRDGSFKPAFEPRDLRRYLPHLRSITRLDSLTLDTFCLPMFTPVFNEYFGIFTNSLRHLDIRRTEGAERYLLYIISQFTLLEDLTVLYPVGERRADPGYIYPFPKIKQSPPLRGKLALVQTCLREFSEGLAAFPGGLNFRSLELSCKDPQAILAACGRATTSISYLWQREHTIPLDLKQNVALERFELSIDICSLSLVYGWIYLTLRSITSPVFNKFVIWILSSARERPRSMNRDSWKVVDLILEVLAERNPDFRVVIMKSGDWSSIASYLPFATSNGLIIFASPVVENPFSGLGVR